MSDVSVSLLFLCSVLTLAVVVMAQRAQKQSDKLLLALLGVVQPKAAERLADAINTEKGVPAVDDAKVNGHDPGSPLNHDGSPAWAPEYARDINRDT